MPSNSHRTPLVSIIIPTYNYAKFVGFAIDSALAQTHPNLEVIVIDDGSTDNTAEILTAYQQRIRVIHKQNAGLSAARNTGMSEARGEWVVFLDADDILYPQMVETSLKRATGSSQENTVIIGHLADRIDEHGAGTASIGEYAERDTEVRFLDLMVMNRFPATVFARKKALIELGGFDVNLPASEDRDMWIRATENNRIVRLNTALSAVRRHGESMSSNGDRQARCIRTVHEKAASHHSLQGLGKLHWLKIKSFFYYQCAMMTGRSNLLNTMKHLTLSVILWPIYLDTNEISQNKFFRIRILIWSFRSKLDH